MLTRHQEWLREKHREPFEVRADQVLAVACEARSLPHRAQRSSIR